MPEYIGIGVNASILNKTRPIGRPDLPYGRPIKNGRARAKVFLAWAGPAHT